MGNLLDILKYSKEKKIHLVNCLAFFLESQSVISNLELYNIKIRDHQKTSALAAIHFQHLLLNVYKHSNFVLLF